MQEKWGFVFYLMFRVQNAHETKTKVLAIIVCLCLSMQIKCFLGCIIILCMIDF